MKIEEALDACKKCQTFYLWGETAELKSQKNNNNNNKIKKNNGGIKVAFILILWSKDCMKLFLINFCCLII